MTFISLQKLLVISLYLFCILYSVIQYPLVPFGIFAKGDQIIAVPTLVRQLPPPVKKIIGDLAKEERVLIGLDLKTAQTESVGV